MVIAASFADRAGSVGQMVGASHPLVAPWEGQHEPGEKEMSVAVRCYPCGCRKRHPDPSTWTFLA